jgi:hypothetical protein
LTHVVVYGWDGLVSTWTSADRPSVVTLTTKASAVGEYDAKAAC